MKNVEPLKVWEVKVYEKLVEIYFLGIKPKPAQLELFRELLVLEEDLGGDIYKTCQRLMDEGRYSRVSDLAFLYIVNPWIFGRLFGFERHLDTTWSQSFNPGLEGVRGAKLLRYVRFFSWLMHRYTDEMRVAFADRRQRLESYCRWNIDFGFLLFKNNYCTLDELGSCGSRVWFDYPIDNMTWWEHAAQRALAMNKHDPTSFSHTKVGQFLSFFYTHFEFRDQQLAAFDCLAKVIDLNTHSDNLTPGLLSHAFHELIVKARARNHLLVKINEYNLWRLLWNWGWSDCKKKEVLQYYVIPHNLTPLSEEFDEVVKLLLDMREFDFVKTITLKRQEIMTERQKLKDTDMGRASLREDIIKKLCGL